MASVFISYARKDGEVASKIADALLNKEHVVNIDSKIPNGSDWPVEVERLIRESNVFVVLISDYSISSKEVRYEINLASKIEEELGSHNYKIIPVEIAKITKGFPWRLDLIQRITYEKYVQHGTSAILECLDTTMPSSIMSTEGTLQSGALLYATIDHYAGLSQHDKQEAFNQIKKTTQAFWAIHTGHINQRKGNFWIRFGKNEFILYIEKSDHDEGYHVMAKAFIYCLHLLASQPNFINIAMHKGEDVHYYININQNSIEFWGLAIDELRSIISCAEGGHLFISEGARIDLGRAAVFNELNGKETGTISEIINRLQCFMVNAPFNGCLGRINESCVYLIEQITIYDRDRVRHSLYNFFIQDKLSHEPNVDHSIILGNSSPPSTWVKLEYRDKRQFNDPKQVFIRNLVNASEVCIIGITNEGLVKFLNKAFEARNKKFWRKLQIIFPSERVLTGILEQYREGSDRVNKWNEGKKAVLTYLEGLESKSPELLGRWTCLETDRDLSFWGNRFTGENRGVIRFAPILPGIDLREGTYFTLLKDMDAYDKFSKAFDAILQSGMSMREWNLYGECTEDGFIYKGIARRSCLKDVSGGKDVAVVLIILYEGKTIYLQKRTPFNAQEGFGKYSNISGYLSVADLASPGDEGNFHQKLLKSLPDSHAEHDKKLVNVCLDCRCATEALGEISQYKSHKRVVLPDDVWKRAALRELNEELGLFQIKKDRLEFQKKYCLRGKNSINIFFHIFSLKLMPEEIIQIKANRPYAELNAYKLTDLEEEEMRDNFNHLLKIRYTEVFEPIFKKIGIA